MIFVGLAALLAFRACNLPRAPHYPNTHRTQFTPRADRLGAVDADRRRLGFHAVNARRCHGYPGAGGAYGYSTCRPHSHLGLRSL